MNKKTKTEKNQSNSILHDLFFTLAVFAGATGICALIHQEDTSGSMAAIMIFVLAVLFIARKTTGYIWGILASFTGVIVVNLIFTYPFWELNFTLTGYPLTFFTMLVVSVITSATSTQIKHQDYLKMENEKEQIRSNLLRAISHDIRTPLTSIVGSSSLLMDDNNKLTDEQKHQLLKDVNEDAEWLIRVTENILSITRIDGDAKLHKKPELIEEVVESSIRKFNKRHTDALPIEVTMPKEPVLIPMDIVLIEQVVLNLLENAFIHGIDASKIGISLEVMDNMAKLSIMNDGVAIPDNILPTIFDGRLRDEEDLNNSDNRCMGIGLSVCRAIVKAHGGNIEVKNIKSDRGVVFSFYLPTGEQVNKDEN